MYRNHLYYYVAIQQLTILIIYYLFVAVFMTPFSINAVARAIIMALQFLLFEKQAYTEINV